MPHEPRNSAIRNSTMTPKSVRISRITKIAKHTLNYFMWIPKVRIKQSRRYKVGKIGGVILSDGTQTEIHLSRQTFFCKNFPPFHFCKKLFLSSQLGVDQQPVGSKHLHLQPEDLPSH